MARPEVGGRSRPTMGYRPAACGTGRNEGTKSYRSHHLALDTHQDGTDQPEVGGGAGRLPHVPDESKALELRGQLAPHPIHHGHGGGRDEVLGAEPTLPSVLERNGWESWPVTCGAQGIGRLADRNLILPAKDARPEALRPRTPRSRAPHPPSAPYPSGILVALEGMEAGHVVRRTPDGLCHLAAQVPGSRPGVKRGGQHPRLPAWSGVEGLRVKGCE
ncbi:hypothetical protein ACKKBF_B40925 [Auxenochlorella protothecoides x Auxenochlorella symbiontica]